MEEDLHIFGLVGTVDGAGHTTKPAMYRGSGQPGHAKPTTRREEATYVQVQRQQAHPPNSYDEFATTTGREGGGWGMATGGGIPGGAGREERRSAAVPRAFAMNVDRVSGLENVFNGTPYCTAVCTA